MFGKMNWATESNRTKSCVVDMKRKTSKDFDRRQLERHMNEG
jgi:hypothetical protein